MTVAKMALETSKPIVSVVMAVYNGEAYLRQALDSILAQTFENFELIIVDDASTDKTPQILMCYNDPRIVILRNNENCGPYRSANRGILIARGKFIARHDADDISLPERFEQQVKYFQSEPSLGLLGTSYYMIDHSGNVIDTAILPTDNDEVQTRLMIGNIFCQGSVMFRREDGEQVGFYRETYPVSQDYDLWLRLAEKSTIANLETPLYLFRFHSKSLSRNKRELQLACRQFALELAKNRRGHIEEIPVPKDILAAYPPDPQDLFREARGSAYLYYASGAQELASEALQHAKLYYSQLADKVEKWDSWVVARAHKLSEVKQDISVGAGFIRWASTALGGTIISSVRYLLSRFYADQAFMPRNSSEQRRRCALEAIRNDWSLVLNRGLISRLIKNQE